MPVPEAGGRDEDFAGAILMMVSDYRRYVTGRYMPVAGDGLML